MIAAISLIRRRSDISLEQFRRHWLHPHGTMTAELPATRRYVQHHVLLDAPGTNDYARQLGLDGIPELWFDDIDARTVAYSSKRIAECNVDSENFIGAVSRVVSEPQVLVETAEDEDRFARILLLAAGSPDVDWSRETWSRIAPLGGLAGYTSHRLIEQAAAPNSRIPEMVMPIAGLAEAVFEDEAALVEALSQLVKLQDASRTAIFRVTDHRFV